MLDNNLQNITPTLVFGNLFENAIESCEKQQNMGIGTYPIRNIAEKSGGSCTFSFKNNVFKASIILAP